MRRHPATPFAPRGFTLVEIVLAIGLATVLLLLALTFYHQSADMRGQILQAAGRVSTLRLVLDRMANDLRAAQTQAAPGREFTGDTWSMQFVKIAYLPADPAAPLGTGEPTDLAQVSFATVYGTNGTDVVVRGLDRTETPLGVSGAAAAPAPAPAALAPALAADTNAASLALLPAPTNQVTEPFAEAVRFVRFRYWDGASWQPGWTNANPPLGVELVLAAEAVPADAPPDSWPAEPLRRVVYLPGGVAHPGPPPDPTAGAGTTVALNLSR